MMYEDVGEVREKQASMHVMEQCCNKIRSFYGKFPTCVDIKSLFFLSFGMMSKPAGKFSSW